MYKKLLILAAALFFVGCGGVERDAQVSQLIQACKQQNKVCICHVPPGNPQNAHEICISKNAWRAHQRNHSLDYLGACDEKCYTEVEKCHTEYVRVCGECSCTYERQEVCETVLVEVPCDEPRCDAGTSCIDSQVPEEDASVPEEDTYVPQPDQSVPNAGVADAGQEEDAAGSSDSSTPEDDQGVTENDATVVVEEDASTPDPVDAGVADAGVGEPDSEVPVTQPEDPDDEYYLAGGGGCAMNGQTANNNFLAVGIMSLLVVLFLLGGHQYKRARILALVAWIIMLAGVAHAGPVGASDFLVTESAKVQLPTVSLFYDYAHRPLRTVLPSRGNTIDNVIDGQHNFNLAASIGLYDRLELGFVLPWTVYQHEGNLAPLGVTNLKPGLGDLQLTTKVRLYTTGGWDFALNHVLGLPTSTNGSLLGETGVTFQPAAVVSWGNEKVEVGVNAGVKIRPVDQSFSFRSQNISTDDRFVASVGVRVRDLYKKNDYSIAAVGDVELQLDLHELNEEEAPLEALAGIEVGLPYNLEAIVGLGVGLTRGIATPVVRPFIGLAWTWETVKPAPCEPVIVEVPKVVEKKKLVPVPVPVPVPVAVVLSIPTVYFDTDKADLRPEGVRKLEWLVKQLKRHPEVKTVRIEGHTDHRASDKYNQALSERRVQTCVDFLADSGISLERLDARAYGETQRVDTTETDEGMQLNRRVEFTVTKVDRP